MQDADELAERLRGTEALVLIRERTQVRTPLLERLPNLRLISQRSVFPHIDLATCTQPWHDRLLGPASGHPLLCRPPS